jgi:acyl-CoA thioesterase-1
MTAVFSQTKIMCLGDSITKGAVDPGPSLSGYRARLFDDLNSSGVKYQFIGCTVTNSNRLMISAGQAYHNGYGSFRIDQICKNLDGVQNVGGGDDSMEGYWLTGGNGTFREAMYPDVVLLLAGTNDLGQGATEAELESRMTDLLNWFQTHRPNSQMFVATVPPRGSDKEGHEKYNVAVIAFNQWLVRKVPNFGPDFHLVDIYALFVDPEGQVKGSDFSDGIFLQDGVHPSHKGYAAIGDAWFTAIKPILSSSSRQP